MLVLTRRTGEGILIEGGVCIKVLQTQRGRVRLGIVAPKSIRVDRAELPNHAQPVETIDRAASLADPCTLAAVDCTS